MFVKQSAILKWPPVIDSAMYSYKCKVHTKDLHTHRDLCPGTDSSEQTPHKIKHRITVVSVRKAITDQAPQGDTHNRTHICSQPHTLAYVFKGGKEGWSLQNFTFAPSGVS